MNNDQQNYFLDAIILKMHFVERQFNFHHLIDPILLGFHTKQFLEGNKYDQNWLNCKGIQQI